MEIQTKSKTLLTYLKEAKADDEYQKNYSSIARDIFDKIVKMDPKTQLTPDGQIKNIGFGAKQLLLRLYLKGDTEFVDKEEEVKNALETYYPHISEYPKFPQFNSVEDFITFVNNPETADVKVSDNKAKKENPIDSIYDKYYSDIERDVFNSVIELDLQTTEKSLGEICKNLLLPKYKGGETDFISSKTKKENTKRACSIYYKLKNSLPEDKQRINNYESVESFTAYMLKGPESSLLTSLRNNEDVDPSTGKAVKDDFIHIGSTFDYDILEPTSHRANYAIGGGYNNPDGMHWCTGWEPDSHSENDHWWNNYHSNGGRLICFMNKTKYRGSENRAYNWQVQIRPDYSVGEFLNGYDEAAFPGGSRENQFKNFLLAYPDICYAIKDKDPFNKVNAVLDAVELLTYENKPFILDSKEAALRLIRLSAKSAENLSLINKVIVSIPEVPNVICSNMTSLLSVEFREGVKVIGAQAFKGCVALKGPIVFPESLQSIGEEAFANCTELRGSIKIPNSVLEIKTRAFMGDHCKLKIDKNRTEPIKFANTDKEWVNSHVQSITVQ